MAAIDNFLSSNLAVDISERLAGLAKGKKIAVRFASLELAAQASVTTEATCISFIDQVKAAKGWDAKIDFIDQVVIFHVN